MERRVAFRDLGRTSLYARSQSLTGRKYAQTPAAGRREDLTCVRHFSAEPVGVQLYVITQHAACPQEGRGRHGNISRRAQPGTTKRARAGGLLRELAPMPG